MYQKEKEKKEFDGGLDHIVSQLLLYAINWCQMGFGVLGMEIQMYKIFHTHSAGNFCLKNPGYE